MSIPIRWRRVLIGIEAVGMLPLLLIAGYLCAISLDGTYLNQNEPRGDAASVAASIATDIALVFALLAMVALFRLMYGFASGAVAWRGSQISWVLVRVGSLLVLQFWMVVTFEALKIWHFYYPAGLIFTGFGAPALLPWIHLEIERAIVGRASRGNNLTSLAEPYKR